MPGFLVHWQQKSLLGSELSWGSGASVPGKLVGLPDPCILRGKVVGKGEKLGEKNLNMWNVTQNKVLVIRAKGGSSEYNAETVPRICP